VPALWLHTPLNRTIVHMRPVCCTYERGAARRFLRLLARSRQAKLSSLLVSASHVLSARCQAATSAKTHGHTPKIFAGCTKNPAFAGFGRRPSDATHCALHASHSHFWHTLLQSTAQAHDPVGAGRSAVYICALCAALARVQHLECELHRLQYLLMYCARGSSQRAPYFWGWPLLWQGMSRVQACLSAIFDANCR
jgi:hypothetical protein